MLSAAQMLDELMGRDRNLAPTEKRREVSWEDPDVCKYFLCGFCPHELFVNTRADLGPCDKLHDEKLKKGYEKSSRYERMGYEEEFLRFLQTLLSDVERRIRKGQARLCLNNTQGSMASGPQVARDEKISILTEKINDLVQKAEELGCEGKVEEAQAMMKLCEQLTEERTQLETVKTTGMRNTVDEFSKEMQVCEICGALLVVGDAQQRVDEHLMGKQHMGYAQIRAYVERHKEATRKKLRGEDEEREAKLAKEQEEREERRKKREQEEKERAERRKKRSRSRSKSHSRRRSRSRSRGNRHKRSDSRDRHRRSRSRDRRRDRSRSRDKRRRSRSRDRHSRDNDSRRSRDRRSRDTDRVKERSRDKDRSSRDKDRSSKDRSRDKDHYRERDQDYSSSKRKEEEGSMDYDRDTYDRHNEGSYAAPKSEPEGTNQREDAQGDMDGRTEK